MFTWEIQYARHAPYVYNKYIRHATDFFFFFLGFSFELIWLSLLRLSNHSQDPIPDKNSPSLKPNFDNI